MIYNVYCDESCHLENDGSSVMILGGVYCPRSKRGLIREDLNRIKEKYGFNKEAELKWAKVSLKKVEVYEAFLNYFFDSPYLRFRVLIADKTGLNHTKYHQSHDDWYYKMYYYLLRFFCWHNDEYDIYFDIKDRYSDEKAKKLLNIFHHASVANPKDCIRKIQPVRSNETPIMEITDILIGAFGYANREDLPRKKNEGKEIIINTIKETAEVSTLKNLTLNGTKINSFYWNPNYHEKNN